jgi:hypothetical protein
MSATVQLDDDSCSAPTREKSGTMAVLKKWRTRGVTNGSLTDISDEIKQEASNVASLERLKRRLPVILFGTAMLILCACAVFVGLVYAAVTLAKDTHLDGGFVLDDDDSLIISATRESQFPDMTDGGFSLVGQHVTWLEALRVVTISTSVAGSDEWVQSILPVTRITIFNTSYIVLTCADGSEVIDDGSRPLAFIDVKTPGVMSEVYDPSIHGSALNVGGQSGRRLLTDSDRTTRVELEPIRRKSMPPPYAGIEYPSPTKKKNRKKRRKKRN